MTTRLTLHPSPAVGFEQPFEMLHACHERVERMLVLLERLAPHLAQHGCDADARQAAADVMRYFDLAGPAHHEDEERHVFPPLAAADDAALRALVARLQQQHTAMTQQWQALRADLAAIVQGDAPAPLPAACRDRWQAFAALYRAHIEAEEALAYPAARERVDATRQAAMGREMAARRGAR